MPNPPNNLATAPNARRLLFAAFMAILAAGSGTAIRAGILGDWTEAFEFTSVHKSLIGGAGFTGFCLGIVLGGLVADRFRYGKMILLVFGLHVLSTLVTITAKDGLPTRMAFAFLGSGAFLFAFANGALAATVNPMVATLYPNNRTHYLNVLNAGWPGGLVLGEVIHYFLGGENWKWQLLCFLAPVALYGIFFLTQKFPKSEAAARGFRVPQMLRDVGMLGAAALGLFTFLFCKDGLGILLAQVFATHVAFFRSMVWLYISGGVGGVVWLFFAGISRWTLGAPLLLLLFMTHGLVGVVDLGTDAWLQKFETAIFEQGQILKMFFYTSSLIFLLRLGGSFFQRKLRLTPMSLLLICSLLAAAGLNLVGLVNNFWLMLAALTVYAAGQAFLWPTMLAVAFDRFPRCGAVGISLMGGLGMMSAIALGSSGLGYAQDRFAGDALAQISPGIYVENQAAPVKWPGLREVRGINVEKLEAATSVVPSMQTPSQQIMVRASVLGNRRMFRVDSCFALLMAGIFLALWFYFKLRGGYEPVHLTGGGGVGRRESVR